VSSKALEFSPFAEMISLFVSLHLQTRSGPLRQLARAPCSGALPGVCIMVLANFRRTPSSADERAASWLASVSPRAVWSRRQGLNPGKGTGHSFAASTASFDYTQLLICRS
jgi:hypothetical protein